MVFQTQIFGIENTTPEFWIEIASRIYSIRPKLKVNEEQNHSIWQVMGHSRADCNSADNHTRNTQEK